MKTIGIDIGTTGISGVLIDLNSGNIIKSVTKNGDAFIKTGNVWEKIQDVDKIIHIAKNILDGFMDSDIISIGVTGQMHGIVYFDNNGMALSPLYTWQDGRGKLEYKDTTYAQYLGSFSGYGGVTDFFNRKNGLVPAGTKGYCTIADYFVMVLCGNISPLIHATNLASFGGYDLISGKSDIPYSVEKSEDFAVAGYYKGVPVSVAIGDNQASVLSSATEDALLINVGTGSQVSVISNGIKFADDIEIRPYFENKFLTVGCALCGGRAYSLLKDFFGEIIRSRLSITDDEIYALMGEMLKDKGEYSITSDTRFAGTRTNGKTTGGFYGITCDNFKPREFVHAVLCGMANELYVLYERMGEKRKTIVGTGNGLRKNRLFIDIAERIFGNEINIPVHLEEAAFGSALFSLISVGKFKTVAEAQKLIEYCSKERK